MSLLSNNLAFLMNHHSVSSLNLARETHIPHPTIKRMLDGELINSSVRTLAAIAHVFSVTINQLFLLDLCA